MELPGAKVQANPDARRRILGFDNKLEASKQDEKYESAILQTSSQTQNFSYVTAHVAILRVNLSPEQAPYPDKVEHFFASPYEFFVVPPPPFGFLQMGYARYAVQKKVQTTEKRSVN